MMGSGRVGGLIGNAFGGDVITNSSASGDVTGDDSIGGLVGWTLDNTSITDSSASGNVTGTEDAGGLVGRVAESGTITNSFATGTVTGNANTGGLVGFGAAEIGNSMASGAVTGVNNTGGLAGWLSTFDSLAGAIRNSGALGTVMGTGNNTGGLVGRFGEQNQSLIDNAFATGTVVGADFTGGLIGRSGSFSNTTVSRSFAANNVSGALSTGAFVGATSATSYTENHFVLDSGLAAVGQDDGGNTDLTTDITGDTLANLQAATAPGVPNAAFFTTWSTDIWDFGDATQLPGLIIGDEVFRGDALTPAISESAARGLALYTPMCSGCHGADGQSGSSPAISLLSPVYPCLLYTSPSPRDRG